MKKYCFVFAIIITLIIITFSFSENIWKGEINIIDRITTIINPDKPINLIPTVKLQKVWEVGGEDPGFIFNNISTIDIDENGRVYVVDIMESDVKVFSSSGEYLFPVGNKGQGPGEFENPRNLSILPNQQIVVIDKNYLNRFNIFNHDGEFINSFYLTLGESKNKNISLKERLLSKERIAFSKHFFNNQLILFSESVEKMKYNVHSIWIYDINDKKGRKITSRKKIERRKTEDRELDDRMSLNMQWCFDKNKNIYLIDDIYDYKITVYDTTGKIIRIISREFKLPLKTDSEYKKDLKESEEYVKWYSNLAGKKFTWKASKEKSIIFNLYIITRSMFCDDQNRLWILTNEPSIPKENNGIFSWIIKKKSGESIEKSTKFAFDVFTPDGRFLMKIPFDAEQPRCFVYKNGFLYFAALKEDGFPWLFKYEIVEKTESEKRK
ncbi:6-bladed beta-propeller [candidate division KSB1 bacterium]|nr:6-bladed beta-propeller [candidate division KSB1 bacterium]MBL7095466.1 6-bladed beta-propeller [candidate division KSB1 bacterium]